MQSIVSDGCKLICKNAAFRWPCDVSGQYQERNFNRGCIYHVHLCTVLSLESSHIPFAFISGPGALNNDLE